MPKPLFSTTLQPPTLSLFSSTGTNPLFLFSQSTDPSLPSDSFIHILNDHSSHPLPPEPAKLIHLEGDEGEGLAQSVLHIQSPTLRTTFIRAGSLGLTHPWIHIQVRTLGREWSFEVGVVVVVDHTNQEIILRFSTFQKQPHLKPPHLLHLPLSFPSTTTTGWSTINLNLPTLLPPDKKYSHVSFIKVYATCRLRRIWFSESGPGQKKLPWEFELYGS